MARFLFKARFFQRGLPLVAAAAIGACDSSQAVAQDSPSPAPTATAAKASAAKAGHDNAAPLDAPAAPSPGGRGPVAQGEAFSVWLESSAPLSAGKAGEVQLVLEAKAPYHCNAEYPHKLKLGTPPSQLSYPKALVRGMEVTPNRGTLKVPVKALKAGVARVAGTVHFSVCTDQRCLIEKSPVSVDGKIQ